MSKNLKNFGEFLKNLRINKGLTLRQACKLVNYDPSNWSKVERGILSPPSDEKILISWAKILGISRDKEQVQEFIGNAKVAQGLIPQDILSQDVIVERLPAFFRTLGNKKPTKKEIDRLIGLIARS
jgi:transcriptional regulator with XRE-family HTH domain